MDRRLISAQRRDENIQRAARVLSGAPARLAVLGDDRDLHDYEICGLCGSAMRWTAAQPVSIGSSDMLACDDCVRKGVPIAV